MHKLSAFLTVLFCAALVLAQGQEPAGKVIVGAKPAAGHFTTLDATGAITGKNAATTGQGTLFKSDGMVTANPGKGGYLSLVELRQHSTYVGAPGTSYMGAISVVTEADSLDNSAGVSINNDGKADALYIGVKGKAVGASSPSGIGMNVNPLDNPQMNGIGVNIWDQSIRNQGSGGPVMISGIKTGNPNSDHKALYLNGNRELIYLHTPESAGYDRSQRIFVIANDNTEKFKITADGQPQFLNNASAPPTKGLFLNSDTGNAGYIVGGRGGYLDIRGGANGIRGWNNANNANIFSVSNSGNATFTGGLAPASDLTTATALRTSGTVTADFSLGRIFTVTPSADVTINASNLTTGEQVTFIITTSGTTPRRVIFNLGFKTTGALATGTVDGKVFTVSFICNGSTAYETSRTSAM